MGKDGEVMISLGTAKKLRDAGLEWNPQEGDWFYSWDGRIANLLVFLSNFNIQEEFIFVPRLDQLLAEIEKRGYW